MTEELDFDNLPEGIEIGPGEWHRLRRFGNQMACLYGGRAYLVGSRLVHGSDVPRDWDVRVSVPDWAFIARYWPKQVPRRGDSAAIQTAVDDWAGQYTTGLFRAEFWYWANDMAKQSARGCERTSLSIDFQAYPSGYFHSDEFEHFSRLRMDTRGNDFSP